MRDNCWCGKPFKSLSWYIVSFTLLFDSRDHLSNYLSSLYCQMCPNQSQMIHNLCVFKKTKDSIELLCCCIIKIKAIFYFITTSIIQTIRFVVIIIWCLIPSDFYSLSSQMHLISFFITFLIISQTTLNHMKTLFCSWSFKFVFYLVNFILELNFKSVLLHKTMRQTL